MRILNELPPEPKKGEFVCLDFETYGQTEGKLHRPTGTFACISVNLEREPDTVYQMYDAHDLKKLYTNIKHGTPVYHNALYDLRQFKRYVHLRPQFVWDTMLVEQSMFGGLYQNFSLADLSRRWLGRPMDKDVREDFIQAVEMTPAMKKYAAQDVVSTMKIALLQRSAFDDDPFFKAYTVADEPMIFPVLDLPGIRVDVEHWERMVSGFQDEATRMESELGFNVKSTQQCQKALAKVGLHIHSTAQDILEEYRHEYPLVESILTTRMYRDAVSKYGMKWLEQNVESDGRVYADYHITGASTTGRMSCSNPNMQNIPQRKLPEYRSCFIASDGHVIKVYDVVQQEPCILAYHTQDARLLDAIRKHEDLHLTVARRVFNNPSLTKDDREKRHIGKTINLGTSYGLSAYGLAAKLNISETEAQSFLTQYFRNFSGVHAWINQQRQQGYQRGYVTTALGRRGYLNIHDRGWENNAINSPIQGGAADFTKIWARRTWEKCKRAGLPYAIVAWVHDETVSDIPRAVVKEFSKVQDEAFQEAAELLYKDVPFSLEAETGKSWACKSLDSEAEEIEDD